MRDPVHHPMCNEGWTDSPVECNGAGCPCACHVPWRQLPDWACREDQPLGGEKVEDQRPKRHNSKATGAVRRALKNKGP